ncbi:MAG: electron transport complex subunit E [Ruminococcaceae bacterium]|nr:electron transport complex subunit E [Oscillospiraceae bacterium]
MKKNKYLATLSNGLLAENPTFVQLIGMCPTLAVTTTLQNGVTMGIAATLVLVASNVVISLLRKFIPDKIRIAAYIVIIAGFVSIIEMLLNAFLPALAESLGIFIPLIVVNCIILARAEAFASKNTVTLSALDGLGMGLGFTCALSIVSAIREILGAGTIWGINVLGNASPMTMFILPPGGFIILGLVIGMIQLIVSVSKKRKGGDA